jgi:hypothetical protein
VDSHIVTIQIIIMADKLDDQVAENVNWNTRKHSLIGVE